MAGNGALERLESYERETGMTLREAAIQVRNLSAPGIVKAITGTINEPGAVERIWRRVEEMREEGVDIGNQDNMFLPLVVYEDNVVVLYVARRF